VAEGSDFSLHLLFEGITQGRRAHSERSAVRRMLRAYITNICRANGKQQA
jgi:hypothetical protein